MQKKSNFPAQAAFLSAHWMLEKIKKQLGAGSPLAWVLQNNEKCLYINLKILIQILLLNCTIDQINKSLHDCNPVPQWWGKKSESPRLIQLKLLISGRRSLLIPSFFISTFKETLRLFVLWHLQLQKLWHYKADAGITSFSTTALYHESKKEHTVAHDPTLIEMEKVRQTRLEKAG